jgi:hypothetical protein
MPANGAARNRTVVVASPQGEVDLAQAAPPSLRNLGCISAAGGASLRPAFVEIMIEANDSSRAAADELSLSRPFDAPLVHLAAQARGSVLWQPRAPEYPRSASQAYVTWQQLQAQQKPRVRVLIGMRAPRAPGLRHRADAPRNRPLDLPRGEGAAPNAARLERLLVRVAPDAAATDRARDECSKRVE